MFNFLSLFSGIGAPEKALDRLGVEYNLVNYCEIDKYASKSYAAIHNVPESKNLGDITKVDTSKLPHLDMVCYGFPCQDISLAGRQKGLFNEDGSKTRSGLFFEALRIIEDKQPKVAIAENVKNLTSKKFAGQFDIVLKSLEAAGYNNYWKVLNAKDYGIPQNRERVFIISIRKDIDTGNFKFPEPFELKLRLKDLLEDEVDEKYFLSSKMTSYLNSTDFRSDADVIQRGDTCKTLKAAGTTPCVETDNEYYLSDEQIRKIANWKAQQKPFERVNGNNSVVQTLTARGAGEYHSGMILYSPDCGDTSNLQPQIMETIKDSANEGVIVKQHGSELIRTTDVSGTVTARYYKGLPGFQDNAVLVKEATKQGYTEAYEGDSINMEHPNSKTRRGRVGRQVAQTLTTSPQQGAITNNLRIRKLTPLECFRLMGFDDDDYYATAKAGISNSQAYKQAGNSIVVDVLEYLFKEILEVVDMKRVDDNVVVLEGNDLIDLVALKENEPELYEELLADYPCKSGTYIFKHEAQ